MRITVVIPVYNNENILEEIKEKILKVSQYGEVIIIDDFSRDDTFLKLSKFIEDFNLNQVQIFKNQKNMGPSFSRNVGIKKAKGEYIAFLDSDDDWHPQKIEIQLTCMEKYDLKICGTAHKVIDKDTLEDEKAIDYLTLDDIPISFFTWPKILFKSPFATPSVMIHRSLKDYLFDENIRYSEDYNLWKRITYKHKAVKVLIPLTYTFKHDYISHGGSLSSNLKKMQVGVEDSFKSLMKEGHISFYYKLIIVCAFLFSKIKYIRRLIKVYMSNKKG